ncbi:MAG: transporter [Hyphomicrobiales bacterium]|nr:transporter [Hyphomicrobiales bacterium]
MSAILLEACHVNVMLDGRRVVRDASLSLRAGEFVALVGPNGAGKTSLLKAAAGLLPLRGGTVGMGAGRMIRPRAQHCSYLEQGGRIHWPMSVSEVVALGRLPFGSSLQHRSADDYAAINEAMTDCDLMPIRHQSTVALSGGETARVLLARALAVQAPVLLADEPVASLDPAHQIATMQVLARYAHRGGAVIAVLHDLALALRFADRIIVLQDGVIVADEAPAEILSSKVLDRAFGLAFRSSGSGKELLLAAQLGADS